MSTGGDGSGWVSRGHSSADVIGVKSIDAATLCGPFGSGPLFTTDRGVLTRRVNCDGGSTEDASDPDEAVPPRPVGGPTQ